MAGRRLGSWLPPIALVGCTLAIWELVVRTLDLRVQLLPAPSRIVTAGLNDLDNIWAAARVTGLEVLLGLGLAITVAVIGAFSMWLLPVFERAATPLLVISQTVPMIAMAPLLIIWFGFDPVAKVLLVAMFGFFPMIVSLSRGLSSPTREQIDVATTLGASAWWILLHVRARAAARQFITGLRISVTYAPATAATAEFVGAKQGLGIYLLSAQSSFRTDLVFVGAFVLTVMTLLLYLLVAAAERALVPWRAVR